MCKVLGVSRSRYYGWLKAKPAVRRLENQRLTGLIRELHQESKQSYGSPRIARGLRQLSIHVSRPRVARLMKQAGLRARVSRKFRITTDSKHGYQVSENLLNRNFTATSIAQAWVSDITYVSTQAGWLYLTVVLDLADRQVVGWALSPSMQAKTTTVAALKMALQRRPLSQELIFHSDRGVQYACEEFRNQLKAPIKQSMSRRANCWDNAVAESFFKTLKTECIYHYRFENRQAAALTIFEYIEVWYNRKRMHSSLNYCTPAQMQQLLTKQAIAA
jgi:putative transposase